MNQNSSKQINLVLGGGGIKGIGHVGAIAALEDAGYGVNVAAGCSAGALVAALVASGMDIKEIRSVMNELDFTSLLDSQVAGRLGFALSGISVVRHSAAHTGANLLRWIEDALGRTGVKTFGDLKRTEENIPDEYRYKLVVIVADITHGRLLRLPWDYHLLGLDPDTQSVASAIRAATALPFFYQPQTIGGATLMDGVVVTNFPVGIMRQLLELPEPTVGIRLSFAPEVAELKPQVKGLTEFARSMIITSVNAQAEEMMREPALGSRTIVVETEDVKVTDFHIGKTKQKKLYDNGYFAATEFLKNARMV